MQRITPKQRARIKVVLDDMPGPSYSCSYWDRNSLTCTVSGPAIDGANSIKAFRTAAAVMEWESVTLLNTHWTTEGGVDVRYDSPLVHEVHFEFQETASARARLEACTLSFTELV